MSYLSGSKNVSARLSVRPYDLDTMTTIALEATASSSGKNLRKIIPPPKLKMQRFQKGNNFANSAELWSQSPSEHPHLGRRCYSTGGLFRYSDRFVCLSSVCLLHCVLWPCGQTVQDRPAVCIEIELECGDEISIGTTFDP